MAEEKVILRIDIAPSDLTKKIAENKKVMSELSKETAALKKSNKELDKQLEKGEITIEQHTKAQSDNFKQMARLEQEAKVYATENRKLTKTIQDQVRANKAQEGSIEQLRADLSLVSAEWAKLSEEERKNTKRGQDLAKQKLELTEALKKEEMATGSAVRNVGFYDKAVEGINGRLDGFQDALSKTPGPLGAMTSGIVSATRASLAFIATPLGAVIAVIVGAVAALRAAFTSSEEGQNKWNKIMSVGGAILGNFGDLLADVGEAIIKAFENPQKALKDFTTLLKDNIVNRFEGLMELVPQLGKAIGQLFRGEFKAAAKTATDATGKIAFGVESITDKIEGAQKATSKFIEEQKREAKLAAEVADKRAKADKIERKLTVDRAKLESDIAELRLKSRQEDEFSAQQRAKFLIDAQKLEDELLSREKEFLELRRDAQILENTFSRSAKENLNAEAEAIAKVSQIEAKRFTAQRSTQRELNRVNKEIAREQAALQKEEEARLKELKKLEEERAKIREQFLKERADANKTEEQKEKEALTKRIEELRAAGVEEVAIEKFNNERLAEINEAARNAEFEAELSDRERLYQSEITDLEFQLARKLITQEQFNNSLAQINSEFIEGQIAFIQDTLDNPTASSINDLYAPQLSDEEIELRKEKLVEFYKQLNAVTEAATQDKITQDRVLLDTEAAISAERISLANGSADLIIKALGEETTAGKAVIAIKKAIAIAEIGIGLQQQLQKIQLTALGIAASAPPFSLPAAAAYTASQTPLAIGQAILATAKVLAFERGGFVPEGNELFGLPKNGDNTPALLQPGELVLNKRQQQNLRLTPEKLKAAGVPGLQDGGFATRPIVNTVNATVQADSLEAVVLELAQRPAVVRVTDIKSEMENSNQVLVDA